MRSTTIENLYTRAMSGSFFGVQIDAALELSLAASYQMRTYYSHFSPFREYFFCLFLLAHKQNVC